MPQTVNPHFSHYYDPNEQSLLEDLIEESIQTYGLEVVYLPREYGNLDTFYGEDTLSNFSKSYRIEAYIKTVDFYEGEGEFLSKFGYEIRNELTMNMTIRRFKELVSDAHAADTGTEIFRPREGDLIYFPIDDRLFEITMCEKRSVFFQLGNLYMYTVKCRQFELSAENFSTGVDQIDTVEDDYAYSVDITMGSGFGTYIPGELVTAGNFRAKVVSWTSGPKILRVMKPNLEVPDGATLEGEISGASYIVSTTVEEVKNTNEAVIDNDTDVSDIIIQTTNPLID